MKLKKYIFPAVLTVAASLFLCSCKGSNDVNKLLTLAVKAAAENKNDDALMLSKEACLVSPDNVEALIMRSLMAERMFLQNKNSENRQLALDSALKAYKLAPDNFIVLYTLGRLYSNDKNSYSEAMNYLEKAHRVKPDDTNTLILLSNLAVNLKSDKALNYLQKLQKIDSALLDTQEGLTMFGHAYLLKNDERNSCINFIKAEKKGSTVISNYNLAVAYDNILKRPNNAVVKYEIFLKQSANSPEYARLRRDVEKRVARLKRISRRRRR